jgi:hypothetical protein
VYAGVEGFCGEEGGCGDGVLRGCGCCR